MAHEQLLIDTLETQDSALIFNILRASEDAIFAGSGPLELDDALRHPDATTYTHGAVTRYALAEENAPYPELIEFAPALDFRLTNPSEQSCPPYVTTIEFATFALSRDLLGDFPRRLPARAARLIKPISYKIWRGDSNEGVLASGRLGSPSEKGVEILRAAKAVSSILDKVNAIGVEIIIQPE